jgi:hypothetical protein
MKKSNRLSGFFKTIGKFFVSVFAFFRMIFYYLFRKKPKLIPITTQNDIIGGISDSVETIFRNISPNSRNVSKPYIFTVENTGDTEQEAILYGYSKYIDEPNCGSGKDIKITPANGVSYKQALRTTAIEPFEFRWSRISSSNIKFLKDAVIYVNYLDINGRAYTDPVPVSCFKEKDQNIEEMVDMHYPIKISCETHLSINIPPKTLFVLSIFPSKIMDSFYGEKTYDDPRFGKTLQGTNEK